MKKTILYLLGGMALLSGCEEQELEVFNDRHEVYFEKFFMNAVPPGTETADTTKTSFFFADESDEQVMVDLVVCLAGRKPEADLHFFIEAEQEGTTALPEEYQLEPSYTFRASSYRDVENATAVKDTVRIRMNRTARLKEFPEGIRLVIKLVGSPEVEVGQFERSKAVIILTEDAVKPAWWTPEVEGELFGPYSSKKYKLFLKNIEGARDLDEEMISEKPSQALKLVRNFKKWLDENPQEENDGSKMYVNV